MVTLREAADGAVAEVEDERWLQDHVKVIRAGIEPFERMRLSAIEIAENWTEGRNVGRFHPGVAAADYIVAQLGRPLAKMAKVERDTVIAGLIGAGLSNRQVATVAGVDERTVRRAEVRRSPLTNAAPGLVLGKDGKRYPSKPRRTVVLDAQPVKNVTPAEPEPPTGDPRWLAVLVLVHVQPEEFARELRTADQRAMLAIEAKLSKVSRLLERTAQLLAASEVFTGPRVMDPIVAANRERDKRRAQALTRAFPPKARRND